jgi:hypothetical protein
MTSRFFRRLSAIGALLIALGLTTAISSSAKAGLQQLSDSIDQFDNDVDLAPSNQDSTLNSQPATNLQPVSGGGIQPVNIEPMPPVSGGGSGGDQIQPVPPVSGSGGDSPSGTLATKYWDTSAGAGNGVGGTGTWGTTFSTTSTGDANLTTAASGDALIFDGSAGVITLSATQPSSGSFASSTFNVTGYTLTTTAGSTANQTLNSSLSLGANVNLNIFSSENIAKAITIAGSISGGSGSTITIQGNQTSSAAARLNLSGTNNVISVPIIISETGTGIAGIVGNSAGNQVTGATITNNSTAKTQLGANSATDTLGVTSVIQGTAGLQISLTGGGGSGSGKVTLTGDNTFSGATIVNTAAAGQLILNSSTGQALGGTSSVTVTQGTLLLGNSNQIKNTATMTLNGGTFNTGGFSEHGANNNTAGIGALTLQTTSIIDMGTGTSIVAFADSSGQTWGASQLLKIYNWSGTPNTGNGTDQLYFGTTSSGLTSAQLAQIQIYSDAGTTLYGGGNPILLSNGELVPVPEPSTWIAGASALAVIGYQIARRHRRAIIS